VFPTDPSIIAAALMNRVTLSPGEGLYVPAGQMHAYLSGTGVEVMANSDNVIRGGLTSKHVDVGELVRVVDFEPSTPKPIQPVAARDGVEKYPTPCQEFDVWRITPGSVPGTINLPGAKSARILLLTDGEVELTSGSDHLRLVRGEAAFIPATDPTATISGDGVAFMTASGLR
jgi:mannose-6-phosphate isomerase